MSWSGRPQLPPPGYELAVVGAKDSLQLFAEMLAERDDVTVDVAARRIAAANGVTDPGRRTCVWSRDVDAMVLAGGGVRNASDENTCDARGFTAFASGQQIHLPVGFRPRAPGGAVGAPVPLKAASSGIPIGFKVAGAVAGGFLLRRLWRAFSNRRGAA